MTRPQRRARKGPEKFKLVPKREARQMLAALGIKSITFDGKVFKLGPLSPRGKACAFSPPCVGLKFFNKEGIFS